MSTSPSRDPQGIPLLEQAAAGDKQRLAQFISRYQKGEPAPYITGFMYFRGRRFAMDPRAYVTDPETTVLIDAVLQEGDAMEARLGRPLRIVDFGVGAGTLALTLALERPQWSLIGLDIDPASLDLARENAQSHQVDLPLYQSNLLDGWPDHEAPPDILYGDPPWGTEQDLYDQERNIAYYDFMPHHTVFPPTGSRTGIHDSLLESLSHLQWPTRILLNYGILPRKEIERSAHCVPHWKLSHPQPGISLLKGHFTP